MVKKFGLLLLGFALLTGMSVGQIGEVLAAPAPTIIFDFDDAADYNFPAGAVDFVEIAGKTVAKRVTPDVAACSWVGNKVGIPFTDIESFSLVWEQYGDPVPASLATPILSPDGVNWYYWNQMDNEWKEADVESGCSWGIDIELTPAVLSDFVTDFSPGMLYFRIYLGTGTFPTTPPTYTVPIVDSVEFGYYEADECESSADCDATQYCKKNPGECDSIGVCADKPLHCPLILSKVCGCNEVTYSNSCTAVMAGATVNYAGTCVESCTDNILNQDETSVDCGGICDPCPTCSDGIKNQDETAVDCGGVCSPCAAAVATCTDGIKNQDEEEIDCGGVCTACEEETGVFVDVPATHDHAEAINYLEEEGIVSGYDATHFGPNLKLRRGELLKIALNGAGINSSSYATAENPYSDLDDDHTLKQYILYAYHNEIATGYGDGTFGADNYSSQAEAAKMLLNINDFDPSNAPAGVTYGLPAGDLRGFVHQAMEMNLLYDSSNYVATNDILRGYAAEIMYRILMVEDNSWSSFQE
ncbi:MAG: S-layer homology domain-containing protein [Candidatus Gracilibacteria bacterium]|nr:S-layer homology domain-containing protein [Candidatus Gracilibacteria bacterium]